MKLGPCWALCGSTRKTGILPVLHVLSCAQIYRGYTGHQSNQLPQNSLGFHLHWLSVGDFPIVLVVDPFPLVSNSPRWSSSTDVFLGGLLFFVFRLIWTGFNLLLGLAIEMEPNCWINGNLWVWGVICRENVRCR